MLLLRALLLRVLVLRLLVVLRLPVLRLEVLPFLRLPPDRGYPTVQDIILVGKLLILRGSNCHCRVGRTP